MNNPANYDFVVYGASGFTGKLVVEYALNQYSNEDISWAIAGRNLEKLQNLKEKLQYHDLPLKFLFCYPASKTML